MGFEDLADIYKWRLDSKRFSKETLGLSKGQEETKSFCGKGRAEGGAEIAEEKAETGKKPEEERFQRQEIELEGDMW